MSAEKPQEFDPNVRWLELSLRDGIPDARIRRIAGRVANHLFEGSRIAEVEGFSNFGTRTFVLVDIEGDKDLRPDELLTPHQARERGFVKRVLAAAETPHESWLVESVDPQNF